MSEPVVVRVQADTGEAHGKIDSLFTSIAKKITPTIDVVNALKVAWDAVAAAVGLASDQLKAGVADAIEAERATTRLANALSLAGDNSQSTLRWVEAFNDRVEKSTGITAEATAAIQHQALAMGILPAHIEEVTKATIGWAEISGKDLRAALEDVSTAVGGKLPEQLAKLHPEIKKSSEALDLMSAGFRLATENADTTHGRLVRLGNAFGEVREKIGEAVLKSEAFARALETLERLTSSDGLRSVLGSVLFGESESERTRSVRSRAPFRSEAAPVDLPDITSFGGAAALGETADANQARRAGPSREALREIAEANAEWQRVQAEHLRLTIEAHRAFEAANAERLDSERAYRAELLRIQESSATELHERRMAERDAFLSFGADLVEGLRIMARDTEAVMAELHSGLTSIVVGLGQALGQGLASAIGALVEGGKGLGETLAGIAAGIFDTLGAQLLGMAGVLGILGIFNPALLPVAGAMGAAGAAATVAGALIRKAAGTSSPASVGQPAPGIGTRAPVFPSLSAPRETQGASAAPVGTTVNVVIGYGAVITDSKRQIGRVLQEILDDYAALSPRRT